MTLEEEGVQKPPHQSPEPEQWELGVDGPRLSHLLRRECSSFVSYCGMRRQIDEGLVIPLGSDETADRAASPRRRPLRLPELKVPEHGKRERAGDLISCISPHLQPFRKIKESAH